MNARRTRQRNSWEPKMPVEFVQERSTNWSSTRRARQLSNFRCWRRASFQEQHVSAIRLAFYCHQQSASLARKRKFRRPAQADKGIRHVDAV